MNTRRSVQAGLAILLCLTWTATAAAARVPRIEARSAVLMDVATGTVLYELRPEERRQPAATVKILTALLALEGGGLDGKVEVSPRAVEAGGSSTWLVAGARVKLEDLLYALLLESANDASVAVAEHTAGSVERFVEMMNARARQIGARDTRFSNPHGLYDSEQYCTAYDLALIARHALGNPEFARLVATKRHSIIWPSERGERGVRNQNRLLWRYPGADGVKTGYTRESGPNLVASASRDGMQLVAVIMSSTDIWSDAGRLLDYGFDNFGQRRFAGRGELIRTVRVQGGSRPRVPALASCDLVATRLREELGLLEVRETVAEAVAAPVEVGQSLGRLELVLNGTVIDIVEVVAGEAVERSSTLRGIWNRLAGLVLRTLGR